MSRSRFSWSPKVTLRKRGSKSIWPELVGLSVEEAVKQIQEGDSDVFYIDIVCVGDRVDSEYQAHRVQVFVDESNKVLYPPQVG